MSDEINLRASGRGKGRDRNWDFAFLPRIDTSWSAMLTLDVHLTNYRDPSGKWGLGGDVGYNTVSALTLS